MLEIHIQKALKPDAERINEVMKAAFKEYSKVASPIAANGAFSETIEDTLNDIQSCQIFYKAVCDGDIVGSVRVRINGKNGYLSRFSVLPEYQRYGIGHILIDNVDEAMKDAKAETLTLHTCLDATHLVKFYTSYGFEIIGEESSRGYRRGTFIKKYK